VHGAWLCMVPGIDLSKLTAAEKDALILSLLPLAGHLAAALARVAELEARLARLERPGKTPDNSSLPPSKGRKPERPNSGKPLRRSRPGFGRALEANPDRVVDAMLGACPHCAAAFPAGQQTPQQVHDRIGLPPVRPDVTRVRLFGGKCACCGAGASAPAPCGLEPGSRFGQPATALVVCLRYAQAIGLERLAALTEDPFGLSIPLAIPLGALASGSEGATSSMLARAHEPLLAAAATAGACVIASAVVWCRTCPAAPGRRSGCRICLAASAATGCTGRCAWGTCCATHLRRGVRRHRLQRRAPAAAARHRHRAAAERAGRQHPPAIPGRPGPQARPDHGRCPHWRARAQAAPPHRFQPGAPLHVHHQPRRARYQHRVQTPSPPQRDLPQSNQQVPLRVGRRNLRRLPNRRQHRKGQLNLSARHPPLRPARSVSRKNHRLPRVSNYVRPVAAGLFPCCPAECDGSVAWCQCHPGCGLCRWATPPA